MMCRTWLLCLALGILTMAVPAAADPVDGDDRTLRLSLWSEMLGEHRDFVLRLPAKYHEQADRRFPVFYVTDADWNFPLVAEMLDYLAHWGRIPPFIAVGAINVSRNRDFLPRQDPAFPSSGGGDRFLHHLQQEWIPWIEARFRTSDHRVLFGHSFGGVLVLNQLFTSPEVFDAYIALGSSVWVADEVMLDRAERFFASDRAIDGWLYLSVGEGDGGATVPAGDKLAELLSARAPDSLEWSHTVMPAETHFTNVPISLHRALASLFPTWGDDSTLLETGRRGGPDAVSDWFAERADKRGWRFVPQGLDLGLAALRLTLEGHEQAGLAVFDILGEMLPTNPEVAQLQGQALAGLGRTQKALETVDRAVSLARRAGYHPDQLARFVRFKEQISTVAKP